MYSAKKLLSTTAVAIFVGAAGLVATTGTASARIVCNAEGDCWHTDSPAPRVAGVRLVEHPDDWYFHQRWENDRNRHYRDYHEGRGYYRRGVWVTL